MDGRMAVVCVCMLDRGTINHGCKGLGVWFPAASKTRALSVCLMDGHATVVESWCLQNIRARGSSQTTAPSRGLEISLAMKMMVYSRKVWTPFSQGDETTKHEEEVSAASRGDEIARCSC